MTFYESSKCLRSSSMRYFKEICRKEAVLNFKISSRSRNGYMIIFSNFSLRFDNLSVVIYGEYNRESVFYDLGK
jgi:hypothetical protein